MKMKEFGPPGGPSLEPPMDPPMKLTVHSHLRFIRRELLAKQWAVLSRVGAFALAVLVNFCVDLKVH